MLFFEQHLACIFLMWHTACSACIECLVCNFSFFVINVILVDQQNARTFCRCALGEVHPWRRVDRQWEADCSGPPLLFVSNNGVTKQPPTCYTKGPWHAKHHFALMNRRSKHHTFDVSAEKSPSMMVFFVWLTTSFFHISEWDNEIMGNVSCLLKSYLQWITEGCSSKFFHCFALQVAHVLALQICAWCWFLRITPDATNFCTVPKIFAFSPKGFVHFY